MKPFGMPGLGGSLGQCALCGGSFVAEILLGTNVHSFKTRGCSNTLFGHDGCMEKYDGKQMSDLPPESPLRKAYERQKNRVPSGVEPAIDRSYLILRNS